jgi:hypothetical protein
VGVSIRPSQRGLLPPAHDFCHDLGVLDIASSAPRTAAAFVAGTLVAALGGGVTPHGNFFLLAMIFAALGGIAGWGIRGVR